MSIPTTADFQALVAFIHARAGQEAERRNASGPFDREQWRAVHTFHALADLAQDLADTALPSVQDTDATHALRRERAWARLTQTARLWDDHPDFLPAWAAPSGRPVVAYRSRDGRQLRCLAHAPDASLIGVDWHACTAWDVDGGASTCTATGCGVDVLAVEPERMTLTRDNADAVAAWCNSRRAGGANELVAMPYPDTRFARPGDTIALTTDGTYDLIRGDG